jgi:hypothetical protein
MVTPDAVEGLAMVDFGRAQQTPARRGTTAQLQQLQRA